MSTWIFCSGMLRSGSTLQYQIVADILEYHGTGRRAPYYAEDQFAKAHAELDGSSGHLAYKSHFYSEEKASLVHAGRAKVVYCFRDLRDVVVSASRKFEQPVDTLLSNGWVERAVVDSYRWSSLPNALISKYEDFVGHIDHEASRIATFLGMPIPDHYAHLLGRRYSLEQQRQRLPTAEPASSDRTSSHSFDATSLLHSNHIDDGATNKWMTQLNLRQQNRIESTYRNWLVERGYHVD